MRQNGWSRKNGNERAVSESIGFILVFGIIIAGIALVTLSGYPMLLQQQSSANERIMEKNMICTAERCQEPRIQNGTLPGNLAECGGRGTNGIQYDIWS